MQGSGCGKTDRPELKLFGEVEDEVHCSQSHTHIVLYMARPPVMKIPKSGGDYGKGRGLIGAQGSEQTQNRSN